MHLVNPIGLSRHPRSSTVGGPAIPRPTKLKQPRSLRYMSSKEYSLSYQVGDLLTALLEGEIDVACHGCNCFCTMGKGLAAQVQQRIPTALEADKGTRSGDKAKLGTYSSTTLSNGGVFLNCYTQYHYSRALNNEGKDSNGKRVLCDYDAVRKVMQAVANDFPGAHVGLPLIGAGLARGDWQSIEAIIAEQLLPVCSKVTVFVLSQHHLDQAGQPQTHTRDMSRNSDNFRNVGDRMQDSWTAVQYSIAVCS
eukprot:jgi/Ulvmu1/349/UM001_0354.1